MASNRIIAVLLVGFALSAVSASPCDPVKKTTEEPCTKVKGLSDGEIAGIAVGTAAGVAAIGGGVAVAVGHNEEEPEGSTIVVTVAPPDKVTLEPPDGNQ